MNFEQVTLMAQKSFVDANLSVLAGIEEAWKSQYGANLSGLTSLRNTLDAMKKDSEVLQQDIIDLECEEQDLNEKVTEILIRRAEDQVRKRNLQLPPNFLQDHTEMQKRITDRTRDPHMWVVNCSWKTAPQSTWGSDYPRRRKVSASLLCGRSDGQDWVVRVPGTIQTVEKALDWLVPAVVKKAQRAGKTAHRQGDMYFIQQRIWDHDMEALQGSRHSWSGGYRGTGTVSHPQHPEVKLSEVENGYAWRAIQQKQMANDNGRVGAD
jgi:hypothetical protein